MTWRHLRFCPLSHVEQKAEKLVKYGEIAKARRVKSQKIGLGVHGLKIHLAHEDGWQWWKELVEGMAPISDENGSYTYRFLKPGEEAFRSFLVYVPDDQLTDREAAPTLFRNELLTNEETWEEFEWECQFVGTRVYARRPVVVMKLTIPEDRTGWLLTHCSSRGCIQYGAETHKLWPYKPGGRSRPSVAAGAGPGGPGEDLPPPSEGDGEDDGEEVDNEEDEEDLAGGGEEIDEAILDDQDDHEQTIGEDKGEPEKEKKS